MKEYKIDIIRNKAVRCLTDRDVRHEEACLLIDHLITADMCGRASHGLGERLEMLLRQAEEGRGRASFDIVSDKGAVIAVDGNNGFGYSQAQKSVELLIERVTSNKMCAVALSNTGHTGRLGHYVSRGAEADVVTMAFSHCTPLMAPYGGSKPLLGTNPMAFGFPRSNNEPVIVDLGCATITFGELKRYRSSGEPLPPDSALGPEGKPTRNPEEAVKGCLLPFGGARGGALAVAVQILAGALTGSPSVPPAGKGYGLLLIGLSKDSFTSEENYEKELESFIDQYEDLPTCEKDEVRLPGMGSSESYRRTAAKNTMAVTPTVAQIIGLGKEDK